MNAPRKKILFVCLGNSCRSQMAEGFARAYGSDVIEAQSAGLTPAATVSTMTIKVMQQRNVDMTGVFPKLIYEAPGGPFDLIVNISGFPLPRDISNPVREWTVQDPIAFGEEVYEQVASKIEGLVMQLILELRKPQPGPAAPRAPEPPTEGRAPFPMGPGGSRMYRRNR